MMNKISNLVFAGSVLLGIFLLLDSLILNKYIYSNVPDSGVLEYAECREVNKLIYIEFNISEKVYWSRIFDEGIVDIHDCSAALEQISGYNGRLIKFSRNDRNEIVKISLGEVVFSQEEYFQYFKNRRIRNGIFLILLPIIIFLFQGYRKHDIWGQSKNSIMK